MTSNPCGKKGSGLPIDLARGRGFSRIVEMIVVAENRKEPEMLEGSNTIFEVEYFDLPGGDITSIPCSSRDAARILALNTIKNKG
jgi:hypothetical protein